MLTSVWNAKEKNLFRVNAHCCGALYVGQARLRLHYSGVWCKTRMCGCADMRIRICEYADMRIYRIDLPNRRSAYVVRDFVLFSSQL